MKKEDSKDIRVIYDSTETCEENEYWLDDERENLDMELDGRIVAIADLGLWDGRKNGYRMLGNNLNEILTFFGCDDITVSFDGKDVVSSAFHHDGKHHIVFREMKGGVDEEEIAELILNGECTDEVLGRYTKSLGPHVCGIYGWKLDNGSAV